MSDKIKKKPGKKPGVKQNKKREIEIEYDYQAIRTLIPYIYDWFANHHTTWPSQTCRWGPTIQDKTFKWKQRIYSSEQTDGSDPNRLLILDAEVCKKRISGAENLRQWKEGKPCQYIRPQKSIVHPGEVNKVRELPQHQNIVVTHTDAPELFLWNTDTQPDRTKEKGPDVEPSVADIILKGHTDNAQFALGISKQEPLVASGGQDQKVLIWDLQTSLSAVTNAQQDKSAALTLDARDILDGHKDTVEDVNFKPSSNCELVSVGDDKQILVWDLRSGTKPVHKVVEAHGSADLQCVDWDPHEGYQFATGCQKGALRIWDIRNLSSNGICDPVHQFKIHKGGLVRIEWSPTVPNLLASGGEDKQLYCWKLDRPLDISTDNTNKILENPIEELRTYQDMAPQELLFHHAVHRGNVVDFQWHQQDPYMMLSLSDEAGDTDLGGGTLQMWRIHDMIYKPINESIAEVRDNIEYIAKGQYNPQAKRKKTDSAIAPPENKQISSKPQQPMKVFTKKSDQQKAAPPEVKPPDQENKAVNGDVAMNDVEPEQQVSLEKYSSRQAGEIAQVEEAAEVQGQTKGQVEGETADGLVAEGNVQEQGEPQGHTHVEENGKVNSAVLEEKMDKVEQGENDGQESTKAVVDEEMQQEAPKKTDIEQIVSENDHQQQQEQIASEGQVQDDGNTQSQQTKTATQTNGEAHPTPTKGKQKVKGQPLLGQPSE